MRSTAALVALLLLQSLVFSRARAAAPVDPALLCAQLIPATERRAQLPPQLLRTIALVESGRRDARTGGYAPWPWTINADGYGLFFDTKDQAIAAVQSLQAHGVRSIDVGCMQISLLYHPDAFASLDEAFEPQANVSYAARFLKQLFLQTNDWPKAAAAYHSQTPEIGADYQSKVMALWPLAARYAEPELAKAEASGLDRRLALEASDRAQIYARIRGAPPAPPRAGRLAARSLLAAKG